MTESAAVSRYRWAILGSMVVGITALTYSAFLVPALAAQVIPAFSLSQVQFGAVTTVPFLAGAIFGLPGGMAADRFGVKRVVTMGLVIALAGAAVRVSFDGFTALFIGNFGIGIGLVLLEANAPKYLGAWFGHRKVGLAMGLLIAGTWIGPSVAFGTANLLSRYRISFTIAMVAVLLSLVVWVAVARKTASPRGEQRRPLRSHLIGTFRSGNLWLCNLSIFLVFGGGLTMSSFLVQSLVEGKDLTPQYAGLSVMALNIIAIAGAIGAGWLAQRLGRFRPVVIVLALLTAAGYYLAWRVPGAALTLILLLIVGLVEGGVAPVAKAIVSRMALAGRIPLESVGTAGGVHTSIMYIGGFLLPTYLVAGVAGDNFHLVFIIAALLFVAGGVVNLFVPEFGPSGREPAEVMTTEITQGV